MQLVLDHLQGKRKQQEEDEDNAPLKCLLENWVQDKGQKKDEDKGPAQKKQKKQKKKKKKKKKKYNKTKETEKKCWQRWAKRLRYMEELGEVEGNRQYMDEHAQKSKQWRLNKRKREDANKKKQKKNKSSKK